jgi:hypothetical protein
VVLETVLPRVFEVTVPPLLKVQEISACAWVPRSSSALPSNPTMLFLFMMIVIHFYAA